MPIEPDRTWLVVGLGNPGSRYADTRHNVGFQVLDLLAARRGATFGRSRFQAQVADYRRDGARLILVKPQTWMNLSGEAVQPLLHWHKIPPTQLIVVYDEMDLPLGRIRLRERGSAGGHNGVQSIIQRLNSNGFPRVRVGVDRPPRQGPAGPENVDYLLTGFRRDELETIAQARERAADAVEAIVAEGVATAMNRFNAA